MNQEIVWVLKPGTATGHTGHTGVARSGPGPTLIGKLLLLTTLAGFYRCRRLIFPIN